MRRVRPSVLVFVVAAAALSGPAARASSNDQFSDAIIVETVPSTYETSTVEYTMEPGEPQPFHCQGTGATAWYRFTAPRDMTLLVDTAGSSFYSMVALWRGQEIRELQPLTCNNTRVEQREGAALRDVVAGETVVVQIGGLHGDKGDLLVRFDAVERPVHDRMANAFDITSVPFAHDVDTSNASIEPHEPAPVCQFTGATVWYRFTPSTNVTVVAKTFHSDYDTVIAVWEVEPEDYFPRGCNDDAVLRVSMTGFAAAAGKTYLIQVGGWNGSAGRLRFSLREGDWFAARQVFMTGGDDEDRVTRTEAGTIGLYTLVVVHEDKRAGSTTVDACSFVVLAAGCVVDDRSAGASHTRIGAVLPFLAGAVAAVDRHDGRSMVSVDAGANFLVGSAGGSATLGRADGGGGTAAACVRTSRMEPSIDECATTETP